MLDARTAIWATGLSCLAILAKLTMSFTLVVLVLAFGLEWFTFRTQRKTYLIAALVSMGTAGLLAMLLTFQPTINNHIITDQIVFGSTLPQVTTAAYWLDVLKLSISSGYARFGWMNVPAPEWQAYAWWAFIAVTTCWLAKHLEGPRSAPETSFDHVRLDGGVLAIPAPEFKPLPTSVSLCLSCAARRHLLFAVGFQQFWKNSKWSLPRGFRSYWQV
jgi:hypothetical protein